MNNIELNDEYWMRLALAEADKAQNINEIPVGAVVVCNNECIAVGYNQSILLNDPSAHAEVLAIRSAGNELKNYRLPDCTLYVTLEPCSMCAGLLVHSRIKRLVFGAKDEKTGSAGSIMNLVAHPQLNHQIEYTAGVLAEECSQKISSFFKQRRAEIKALKQQKKREALEK